jgi:hypothetical protein
MVQRECETVQRLLDNLIAVLKSSSAWTERRDTAEFLAEIAKLIVIAIDGVVKSEGDVDIRIACEQALDGVRGHLALKPVPPEAPQPKIAPILRPVQPEAEPAPGKRLSLAEMINSDVAGPNVSASQTQEGFDLLVRLSSGRFQKVHVVEKRGDKPGENLIYIFTPCCPADSRLFKWALESNCKLRHGAIGIRSVDDNEMFVISDTYPTATATGEQIRDAVLAIAEAGDFVEKGLTRVDRF